jgi:hypothetical protein
VISNMMMRMTTRTRRGLGPGKCDGSVGEDELRKGHGTTFMGGGFVQLIKCRRTKNSSHILKPNLI